MLLSRSKLFIIAALALLSFVQARSGDDFNAIKFIKDTLPNGLNVIYYIDKSAPIVVTVVQYNVGSRNESTNQTGYAHFFEHLMFESTANIKRASMDKYIEEAGGELNAFTSFDQTVYHFKVPSNEIRLPLWIESQRMRLLNVDTIGVETQRGVVLEEMKMRQDNTPYGSFLEKMCNNVFPGSNYSWPVIGYAKDISAAKIEDFKKFYDTYYQPNNATLVVAGDFELGEARNYVKEYFGGYPRKPIPPNGRFNVPEIKQPHRETIRDEKAQLPALIMAYRCPSEIDSNYYAFSLLSSILLSGESSRLYKRLVSEEQAVAEISEMMLPLHYAGAYAFFAIVPPDREISNAEKLINEEIEKLVRDGISDEELEKAKNITESSFVFEKKDLMNIAQNLAHNNIAHGNPGMINTELDSYKKVTKNDIIRVAKKYLMTENKVVLTYLPAAN